MTINPKSLKNLKSTKPGDRRNPHGRPAGVKNWQTIYKMVFEQWEKLTPEEREKLFAPIVGERIFSKIKDVKNLQIGVAFRTICAAMLLNDTHARRDVEEIMDGARTLKVQTDVTQKQTVELKNNPDEKTLTEALQVLNDIGAIPQKEK